MTITRTTSIALAATLAGGVALAACGDDAAALSKEDFIAAADAICQTATDEQDPILEAAFDELDEASADTQAFAVAIDEAFDEIGPLVDQQVADIRALAPPEADAEMIDSILDDVESGIDEQLATFEAAAGGDEEALAVLESNSYDPTGDANRRAREYGLVVCGAEE
jgi:hypothetical protein